MVRYDIRFDEFRMGGHLIHFGVKEKRLFGLFWGDPARPATLEEMMATVYTEEEVAVMSNPRYSIHAMIEKVNNKIMPCRIRSVRGNSWAIVVPGREWRVRR